MRGDGLKGRRFTLTVNLIDDDGADVQAEVTYEVQGAAPEIGERASAMVVKVVMHWPDQPSRDMPLGNLDKWNQDKIAQAGRDWLCGR
jgi:hypothetical protein